MNPKPETFGKFLDLSYAAASKSKEIHLNDFRQCNDVDAFFYCAGIRNTKRSDRSAKAKANKDLIKTIFSELTVNPEAATIAISHPVEMMSDWIYQHCNGELCVIGTGTHLDFNRLNSIARIA